VLEGKLTVVIAQDKAIESIQAEEVEEVPRKRGHPADVHIWGFDAALEHGLETQRERERELDCGTFVVVVSRSSYVAVNSSTNSLSTNPWKKKLIHPMRTI
jgi:hypothetical protein